MSRGPFRSGNWAGWVGGALLALALLSGIAWAAAQVWEIRMARGDVPGDTLQYYAGAVLVTQGRGDAIYDPTAMAETQRLLLAGSPEEISQDILLLLNPPFVAVLFLPLTLLPVREAYVAWGVVNVFLAVALATLVGTAAAGQSRRGIALWAVGSISFVPLCATLLLGQVSLLLALSVLAGWTLLRTGRPLAGGLLLAGLLIKPQYALPVLLALILARHWRAVIGLGLGAGLALLVSLLAVGLQGVTGYVTLLTRLGELPPEQRWNPAADYTWRGLAVRLLGEGMPADLLWGGLSIITLALLATLWLDRQRREAIEGAAAPEDIRFAALLIGIVLISPHTFDYDLVLLLPAAALAWRGLRSMPGARWLAPLWLGVSAAVWATFWLHLATRPWPDAVTQVVPVMAGGLVLLALVGHRSRLFQLPLAPMHSP